MKFNRQVVNPAGVGSVHRLEEGIRIGKSSAVEEPFGRLRLVAEMVDTGPVEARGSPHHAVELAAFCQEQLGHVEAFLTCNSTYACSLHLLMLPPPRGNSLWWLRGGSIKIPQVGITTVGKKIVIATTGRAMWRRLASSGVLVPMECLARLKVVPSQGCIDRLHTVDLQKRGS